jgi:rod shape-determining protein MreC
MGARVVTSGMDRIFPRDLPVGTVSQIKAGNPFKQIRIRPAAKLEGLEEVIVLLTLQPIELKKDAGTPAAEAVGKSAPDQTKTEKP